MERVPIYKIITKEIPPRYTFIKIPQYKNTPKNTKFNNFLENNVEMERIWPACNTEDIGALEINELNVEINLKKCIGCMACLSTVKNLDNLFQNKGKILSQIYPSSIISKLNKRDFFKGKLFEFPFFSNRKIISFSQFTSRKETTHISLWASTVINFLCSSQDSRIGKEIEIMKMSDPRDGRLDVCIVSDNLVLVGESKVDLDSLLVENRYRLQIPSYKQECQKFIDEYNSKHHKDKKLLIFLIIGPLLVGRTPRVC